MTSAAPRLRQAASRKGRAFMGRGWFKVEARRSRS
jgi:hypothetical protein